MMEIPFYPGHFDNQGNACVKLHLCGVRNFPQGVEFSGIIDTGFTGFIQLPLGVALGLGLPLEGTAKVMLADGSEIIQLTAQAIASVNFPEPIGKRSINGIVTLSEYSLDILIGMEFLRSFEHRLFLSTKYGVALVPDNGPQGA